MVERSIERASRQFTDVSIQLLPAVRELLSEFRRCSSIHDGKYNYYIVCNSVSVMMHIEHSSGIFLKIMQKGDKTV